MIASQQETKSDGCAGAKHLPIGPPVSLSQPGLRPSKVTLAGNVVTIVPLAADHAGDLYDIVKGKDNEGLFTYLFDNPYPSFESFQEAVVAKSQSQDPVFFAILDRTTSKPVGWASLMRIDTTHRVVEVGNILFSPLLQRTKAATEAMYLLAKYVFEELKYRRYEWKCDNLNGPSKRAAIRFGFTFEGVFRKHMVYKGRSRDTCWFSMVEEDWWASGVKKGFEGWLDEGNFDGEGRQKRRLEDFRGEMKGQKGPAVLEL
jgi:RimJ/RimL family protein N-acetyltransferase